MEIAEALESSIPDDEERNALLDDRQSRSQKHQSDDARPSIPAPMLTNAIITNTTPSKWFRLLLVLLICLAVMLYFIDRKELFHNQESSRSPLIPQDSELNTANEIDGCTGFFPVRRTFSSARPYVFTRFLYRETVFSLTVVLTLFHGFKTVFFSKKTVNYCPQPFSSAERDIFRA